MEVQCLSRCMKNTDFHIWNYSNHRPSVYHALDLLQQQRKALKICFIIHPEKWTNIQSNRLDTSSQLVPYKSIKGNAKSDFLQFELRTMLVKYVTNRIKTSPLTHGSSSRSSQRSFEFQIFELNIQSERTSISLEMFKNGIHPAFPSYEINKK